MFKYICNVPSSILKSVSSSPVRYNSTLAQLSQAIKANGNAAAENNKRSTNQSVISDVDHLLLADSTNAPESSVFRAKGSDYLLQQTLRHPREVAKGIRIFGPQAGRTFDVRHGNLAASIGAVHTILRTNKIRQLTRVQARHIRKAKYQKQKHREWWRRHFSSGFKNLMAQVRDAKRRGY